MKTVKVKASTLQTAAIGSVAVAAVSTPAPAAATASTPAVVSIPVAAPPAPVRTATLDTKAPISPAAQTSPHTPANSKGDLARTTDAAKNSSTTRFDPKYDVVRPEPVKAEQAKAEPVKAEPVKHPVAAPEPVVKVAAVEPAPRPIAPSQRAIRSGWIVQVGALDSVEAAKDRLVAARSKASSLLGRADAFTEPVTKGDKTLHRARFAGLDKDHAEAACKALKRVDIVCMAIKN